MRLIIFTTQATFMGLGLASALFGDTITPAAPKHQGKDYGVEDCPRTICKDGNTKLCSELHFGKTLSFAPIYMGDQPARWSDCETLLEGIKGGAAQAALRQRRYARRRRRALHQRGPARPVHLWPQGEQGHPKQHLPRLERT
ncbi:hypothetical protein PG994_014072 [Apiospora phragmitis]|uniref:Uncharacterized protein n=1 Tax=Apiospora phragmitis TaxID=2905665 RepID=A0ABR1T389_9PEZI